MVEGTLFVCITCTVELSHTVGSTSHLCADNIAHFVMSDSGVAASDSVKTNLVSVFARKKASVGFTKFMCGKAEIIDYFLTHFMGEGDLLMSDGG